MTARRRLARLDAALAPNRARRATEADADARDALVAADPRVAPLLADVRERVAAAITVAEAELAAHGRSLPAPAPGDDRLARVRAEAATLDLAASVDPTLVRQYARAAQAIGDAEARITTNPQETPWTLTNG